MSGVFVLTLDRRLRHFDIKYIDRNTPYLWLDIRDAVKKELEGPSQLLGYRAMSNKQRTEH